jgi:hypothetical protein
MVFATPQFSPQVAKAYELGRVPAFDPVIADEAPLRRTGFVRLRRGLFAGYLTCWLSLTRAGRLVGLAA